MKKSLPTSPASGEPAAPAGSSRQALRSRPFGPESSFDQINKKVTLTSVQSVPAGTPVTEAAGSVVEQVPQQEVWDRLAHQIHAGAVRQAPPAHLCSRRGSS